MNDETLRFYEFGPYSLNVRERLLERGSELVPLTPKVFDTLLVLVERRGHVLEKNELMEILWPNTFVEESSLTQNISLLRKALADIGSDYQYIETIPKRGYRFIAKVEEVVPSASRLVLQERNSTEILIEEEVQSERPYEQPVLGSSSLPARAGRLRKRLKLLTVGCALAALSALAIFFVSHRNKPATPGLGIKSIAILPFKTIGTESNQDLLGVGMADALVLRLSGLGDPTVLPTSSVLKYTNRDQDALSIGKELGVEAVLDGTLQRDGDQIRVTAQLIRLGDGKSLWSGKFDERYSSIFPLQDAISDQLSAALIPQIKDPSKMHSAKHLTENKEAYTAYLMGLYFWTRRNKDNLPKAINYLELAVSKDPNFALAHALLADCYYIRAESGYALGVLPKHDWFIPASTEAAKALELDESLAEAHTTKAGILLVDSDVAGGDREFRRALELNPNYAVAHLRYGYFLFSIYKIEEANNQMKLAQELDPVSPTTNASRGFMLYMSRDYDGAITADKKALELQPDLSSVRLNLGVVYSVKGMFQDGLAEFEKLRETDALNAAQGKIFVYGRMGRRDDARRLLAVMEKSKDATTPFDYVCLFAALGDNDKAFEWLEQVRVWGTVMSRLKFEPQLDPIRSDRRFADYLTRHQKEFLPPSL